MFPNFHKILCFSFLRNLDRNYSLLELVADKHDFKKKHIENIQINFDQKKIVFLWWGLISLLKSFLI